MGRTVTALLVLLLAACTGGSGYRYSSRPVPVPVLASVTLNEPFPVRPDRASEYIQYGAITPYQRVTKYYPHCIFGLRTISATARTVRPDTFTVTEIRRDRKFVWIEGLMFASGNGGDFNMIMSSTELDLHSDSQPDVFRLICQQLDEPYWPRHLTVAEMQQALGSLFTLR